MVCRLPNRININSIQYWVSHPYAFLLPYYSCMCAKGILSVSFLFVIDYSQVPEQMNVLGLCGKVLGAGGLQG